MWSLENVPRYSSPYYTLSRVSSSPTVDDVINDPLSYVLGFSVIPAILAGVLIVISIVFSIKSCVAKCGYCKPPPLHTGTRCQCFIGWTATFFILSLLAVFMVLAAGLFLDADVHSVHDTTDLIQSTQTKWIGVGNTFQVLLHNTNQSIVELSQAYPSQGSSNVSLSFDNLNSLEDLLTSVQSIINTNIPYDIANTWTDTVHRWMGIAVGLLCFGLLLLFVPAMGIEYGYSISYTKKTGCYENGKKLPCCAQACVEASYGVGVIFATILSAIIGCALFYGAVVLSSGCSIGPMAFGHHFLNSSYVDYYTLPASTDRPFPLDSAFNSSKQFIADIRSSISGSGFPNSSFVQNVLSNLTADSDYLSTPYALLQHDEVYPIVGSTLTLLCEKLPREFFLLFLAFGSVFWFVILLFFILQSRPIVSTAYNPLNDSTTNSEAEEGVELHHTIDE